MKDIQRYDASVHSQHLPAPEGPWVRYTDHQSALAAKDARIAGLERDSVLLKLAADAWNALLDKCPECPDCKAYGTTDSTDKVACPTCDAWGRVSPLSRIAELEGQVNQWQRRHQAALEIANETPASKLRERLADEHASVVFWMQKCEQQDAELAALRERVKELETKPQYTGPCVHISRDMRGVCFECGAETTKGVSDNATEKLAVRSVHVQSATASREVFDRRVH